MLMFDIDIALANAQQDVIEWVTPYPLMEIFFFFGFGFQQKKQWSAQKKWVRWYAIFFFIMMFLRFISFEC